MKKFFAKWLIGDIVKVHKTNIPFKNIMEVIPKIVANNGFSVLITHNFKETYENKGFEQEKGFEYSVVQICNAEKSFKALNMSLDMGVMMPKSIIVSQKDGTTSLRYLKFKPWLVSMMFPEIDIVPLSKKVSQVLSKIADETIEKAEMELRKKVSS